MKKFFCAFLSIAMLLSLSANVFAVETASTSTELPGNASSIEEMFEVAVADAANTPATMSTTNDGPVYSADLESEDGESYSVQMFEYAPGCTTEGTSTTKTMVFSTAPEYVTPRVAGSQSNSGMDNSLSMYGYITIKYDRRSYNQNVYEYLLTNVSGGWEKKDNSVVIKGRNVSYTCQYLLNTTQLTHKTPTTNQFNYSTGYTKYIPGDNTSAVVGAVSKIDLAHGTSSKWSFLVRCFITENIISPA